MAKEFTPEELGIVPAQREFSPEELGISLEEKPKKSGVGAALQRGFEQVKSSGQTAIESVTKGGEEAAMGAQARQADIQRRLGEGASWERVKQAYEQKGLLPAIGEAASQIPTAVAEQVPNIGATLGGAAAGAAAGSLAGPVGAVIGGIGGAFAPSFVQQYGGNIQRQAEAQAAEGKPLDISRTAAAGTAVPMAGLDVIGTLIPLGGNMVTKILGPTAGKLLSTGGTKAVEEGLLATITKGTAKGIAAEVPTEVTQQMLERAQAGLPLTTDDALKEYGETAFAVSLLGPIGIIGRVSDKAQAGRDLATAQQKAADTNEPQQVPLQLTYDPTVSGSGGTVNPTPFTVFPDGRVAPTDEAAFREQFQRTPTPVPEAPLTPEELAAQEAKSASYPDNRVKVAKQVGNKVEIYEGVLNENKMINAVDPVTGNKLTFNPKSKNIIVDPTDKDLYQLENGVLAADIKALTKEIKSTENEVVNAKEEFKNWLQKNKIKEDQIFDVLPEAAKQTKGGYKVGAKAKNYFDKEGSPLDDLTAKALEDGILTQEEFDDPTDIAGERAFIDKLKALYANEQVVTASNKDAVAQVDALYNQKDQLEQEFEKRKELAAAPTEEETAVPEFVPEEGAVPAEPVTPAEYVYREPVTPTFRAEAATPYSDKFIADGKKLAADSRKALDRMGLQSVGLKFEEQILRTLEGKTDEISGAYMENLIRVSLSSSDPIRTLNHEALHAMKDLGMFSPKEWKMLEGMAESKWMDQYDIAENYGQETKEIQLEEAIAHAFADYQKQTPAVKTIANRIRKFLGQLRNLLMGRGFRTPDSVFQKAAEGKLKPKDNAFNRWFGNSKVVNEDGSPKVVYHGTDKEDFSIFDPASWFTDNTQEASAYAQTDILRKRERLLNKYKLSDDTSIVGQRIPFASVLSDIGDLEIGKYYAEGGEDGPVYKYLGKNKFEILKNVVVDLDSQNLRDMTTALKVGKSQEAIDQFNETQEYAKDFVGGEGGRVYPVYLSIKNPLYLDAMQANTFSQRLGKSKEDIQKQIDKWKAQGYDGIITTSDEARFFPEVKEAFGGEPNQYIPFDSNQIKSAVGNTGEFKKYDSDIRYEVPSRKKFKAPMQGVDPAYAEKLRQQFTQEPATVKEKMEGLKKNFFDRMMTGLFDEFRAIKTMGGKNATEEQRKEANQAYMMARLSKSIDGGLQGLLEHGQVFLRDGALDIRANTKGLLKILEPVGAEVDQYQSWKALSRDANLPADKRSFPADLVAGRDQLVQGTLNGQSRKEVYKKALDEENQLNKSVLNIALETGLIDKKGYENFASDIYYIPFYKLMEDGDVQSVSNASKLTGQQFSKTLKGGEKKVNDLMENVLLNWSHILSAAMKNQAAVKTIKSAEKMGAAEVATMTAGKYPKDSVKVMEKGQVVHYELSDPDLVDAISTISYLGPKSQFLDIAKGFTNALRYGITLSPAYKVRNLIRDSIQSAAISELGPNMFTNVYNGLAMSKDGHPTFMSALAGGGIFEMGTAHEGNQAKLIKRLVDKGVNANHILDTTDKVKGQLQAALDWYNEQGNKFENANRLALYQKLIDSKKSHLEASFAARDLMDFSMQGQFRAVKIIGSVVPFFNARLQGLYKLGRDGVTPTYRVICNATTGKPLEIGDKQKAMRFATISGAVALASLVLYDLYKDDEDFKRREDWDRDNFWWFKIGDTAYRIPKPFEIGAIGTVAERTYEQMVDENVEGKVFADRMNHILMDTFSLNPTPQMIKPLIDLYANKDSFTGAPIESAGMENLSKQERINNKTSGVAIALGGISQGAAKILTFNPDAQGFSPIQVDYAIKAYLGWLGATATSTADLAVEPFQEGTKVHPPVIDSVAMGFIKTEPQTQSKYMTQFYQNNANLQSALADMRHYAELGDSEKVQQIMEEKGDQIGLAKLYDKTSKQIAAIRKQTRIIENNPNIPSDEKRAEMNRLKILMSDLAEQTESLRKQLKK